MTALTVSTKGWVVIPSDLRKKYSLMAGRKVHIVDYGGVLALIPALDDPIQQITGILKTGTSLTQDLVEEHKKELARD